MTLLGLVLETTPHTTVVGLDYNYMQIAEQVSEAE
jgi:hypothetical protein